MVALSFVQTAADLRQARELMAAAGAPDVPLVAKLERPQALEHLDEILGACDAVMVARGDLGLEMPLERVPRAQKDITRRARRRGMPVIVATQVLESMTDGAAADARRGQRRRQRGRRRRRRDHAGGRDRGRRVSRARRADARRDHPRRGVSPAPTPVDAASPAEPSDDDHAQALCEAAVTLADRGDAQAIVAVTRGGSTARRLSALRPRAPIVAATDDEVTARRLSLYWGVAARADDDRRGRVERGMLIGQELVARGLLPRGVPVVLVSVNPDLARADANFLKIQRF